MAVGRWASKLINNHEITTETLSPRTVSYGSEYENLDLDELESELLDVENEKEDLESDLQELEDKIQLLSELIDERSNNAFDDDEVEEEEVSHLGRWARNTRG